MRRTELERELHRMGFSYTGNDVYTREVPNKQHEECRVRQTFTYIRRDRRNTTLTCKQAMFKEVYLSGDGLAFRHVRIAGTQSETIPL